jgi:hypothetical protein
MLAGDWQIFGQSLLQSMVDVFNNKSELITNSTVSTANKSKEISLDTVKVEKKAKLSKKLGL